MSGTARRHGPGRRRRHWSTLALVGVLAMAVSGPAPVLGADPSSRPRQPVGTLDPAPPRPTGPTVLGATVTFHGRGWGHGVGLSQYGARGRALAGQSVADILGHYYRGTTLGSIALDTPVRVRVLAAFPATTAAPLLLHGRRGTWTIDGVATTFPTDASVRVTPTTSGGTTTWRVTVASAAGAVLLESATTGFRMRPGSSATRLQVDSRTSSADEYRGVLRITLSSTSASASVVNELPMEAYLRGVVPAEVPSTWPAVALQAQAIAARSYAAYRLRPGTSTYDVNDDTSSQVYRGAEGERATTDAAIAATAGVVAKAGSGIANTLFHSTGGGATEHNENVFVSASGAQVAGPLSYLRGSTDRDPSGAPYDADAPYATWQTASVTRAQLSAWFAADARTDVGDLDAIDLRARGVSGRLIRVTLIGSEGSRTVSGDVFRSVFNAGRPAGTPSMRSTLVDTAPIP